MQSVPALVQILVVFALVVLATARKVHLGLAAAVGGLVLALWRGLAPLEVLAISFGKIIDPDTILLVILMAGIMLFSQAMKRSGGMGAFSGALQALVPSPRIAMAIAPLIVGTLPMPGGAIMSAPLVDAMDPGRSKGAETLSAANYWFRHNLELIWPLYPAFIMTAAISGLGVDKLLVLNGYAGPTLFILGLVFILPRPRSSGLKIPVEVTAREPLSRRFAAFVAGVAPLAVVLGVFIVLDIVWKLLAPGLDLQAPFDALARRYVPIYLGLAAGSAYIGFGKAGWSNFRGGLTMGTVNLVAVIVGIMVFSALINAAGVAGASAGELAGLGIPVALAIPILAFISGIVTGIGLGYVGLALPIAMGMLPPGGRFPLEAAVALTCAFGYAGMMLSPLHVCMVVSAEHFGVGLASTMRRFIAPLAVFAAIATCYVLLIIAFA
jgi:uncharacterized protein